MDRLGGYAIGQRLFGNVDYRAARYIFLPEFGIRQALFVDSKAEKSSSTATLQMSQISLRVRQEKGGTEIDEAGKIPIVAVYNNVPYLTSTMLVHYHYDDTADVADPATIHEAQSTEIPEAQPEEPLEPEPEEQEPLPPGSPLRHVLKHVTVAAIPNGILQDAYNPTTADSIWLIGRDSPKLGEDFRVRLAFAKLKGKATWRVQRIAYDYEHQMLRHEWED